MYSALTDDLTLTDVFLRIRHSLIRSAMRIVQDPQIAEDLAQDTYLRARNAIGRGPIGHPEAFLHQTARNLAIDYKRRTTIAGGIFAVEDDGRCVHVVADTATPEETLIHRERLTRFYDALGRLPQRAQTAWMLNRLEKWSHAQIADHLGVSPNTVYNDLKMAMGHCHDAMARLDRA